MITDEYFKLARKILAAKRTAKQLVNVYFDHWVVPYSIPKYPLTENGSQSLSKFFTTICTYLGVKNLTNAEHQLRANKQVERYNRTVVMRLCRYAAKRQKNGDISVRPLKYGYKKQVHPSTNTTPSRPCLSKCPQGPTLLPARQAHHTDAFRNASVQTTRRALNLAFTHCNREQTRTCAPVNSNTKARMTN